MPINIEIQNYLDEKSVFYYKANNIIEAELQLLQ